ncbi:MAG: hypothetical protein LBV49_13155, partial [Azonexus sp.]|nr:hypothetical protein [Azonexus sp.]
ASPEVEAALLEHPAVAECGVIGVADSERGQILKAFVVLNPGHIGDAAKIGELQAFVKNSIAPSKYPRQIEFVDKLPRTETGKLQRFKLKDVAAARGGSTPGNTWSGDLAAQHSGATLKTR